MSEERLHSLDAVRAFALLCGIVLHGTISFSPAWASTGTPIVDSSQSETLQQVFHVLHSFRMLLFFVMAGFFANLLLRHRGMLGFWNNRLKRIAVPLLVGWIVLLPMLAVPFVWALYIKNGGLAGDGRGLAALRSAGVPLGHLWFLYYLLWLYGVASAATWVSRRVGWATALGRLADQVTAWLVRSHALTLLMPIPVALALFQSTDWIPWTGIPSPIAGLVPEPAAATAFGSSFVLGWLLYRQQDLLQVWSRTWPVHAVLAAATSLLSIHLLGPSGLGNALPAPSARVTYLACYTFSAWSWVVAITGFGVRHLSSFNRTWRYLADASYWMYLAHMPLIMLLQVAVLQWPFHWSAKYPLILAAAFALLLASYEYWVRRTFIGRWLNGHQSGRNAAKA